MNTSMGLLLGGVLPAFAFGIGALFQKQGNLVGIGQSGYLVFFALGILVMAAVAFLLFAERGVSLEAGFYAAAHGLCFGVGFVALAMGLTVYSLPIAKLVPLANMSTLVSVVLGLWIFAEHTKLNVTYLAVGAMLIVVGGILVARA